MNIELEQLLHRPVDLVIEGEKLVTRVQFH